MLTKRWNQHRYHADHEKIVQSSARFILMRCGRRSGKTEIALRRLIQALAEKTDWPDNKYFYAAPTRLQAEEIAWEDLKALCPPQWMSGRPNETKKKISTRFGSSVQLFGLDQPQRIEGKGYSGGYVDEMSDVKPNALKISIFPALADRRGWLWMGGVPKRSGVGAVFFNKMFDDAIESGVMPGTQDRIEAYAWESETVLSKDDLAFFKGIMPQGDYDEQFRAIIQRVGGTVFQDFGDDNIQPVNYDPGLPIILGTDFNVDPMCWVMCHDIDGVLCQFDELWLRNTNTPASIKHLAERYGSHEGGWIICGDASSRARTTKANKTDYLHFLNAECLKHKRVIIPKKNPAILDRISNCNALFKSATDEVRYHIDPSCEKTINDIRVRAFKENSLVLDDGADVGHITDALGYIVSSLYPIQMPKTQGQARVGIY